MDKVVVIGGSGFLGSHAADELSRCGYKVLIFDSVKSRWTQEDQEMMVGDMLNEEDLETAMRGARYCYHFAGVADIDQSHTRPVETINLNVMGLTKSLEAARVAKVDRFIYASTMYVYSPFGSFYRASKQASETIIEAYNSDYSLNYTLLRYGSLYGPRAQDWNGLRKYVRQAVTTGRIDYFGSGNERREYIHVRDAARLSVDILDEEHRNKAITVTGSQVLTSKELIDLIFEITGKKTHVTFKEMESAGYHYTMTPYRYTPQKAEKLIPKQFVDLGQGVLELVEELYNEKLELQ